MSIEVMKQALEALETEQALRHGYSYLGGVRIVSTADEAINALRTAIQQAESEPCKSFTELRERHREGVDAELAAMAAEAKTDVRCEGCGYMTHHREHMGCVRAAKQFTHPVTGEPVQADSSGHLRVIASLDAECNSLAHQLNASNERNGMLRVALSDCSAELFAQCGDQSRAMSYVNAARAALAQNAPMAATPEPVAWGVGSRRQQRS